MNLPKLAVPKLDLTNLAAVTAYAIVIGDRFYSKHDSKRIDTAWCLAGAKLFQFGDTQKLDEVTEHLKEKRKKFEVKVITLKFL